MKAEIEIVSWSPAYLDDLMPMWRASFEYGVGITDPHPIEDQRDYFLREVLPDTEVRVALLKGQVVGFAAASPDYLAQLYVHVDFLGQGIGSRLLQWAKDQSGGSLWLYTFERNRNARAFYEAKGFRETSRGFEEMWQLPDIKYAWSSCHGG